MDNTKQDGGPAFPRTGVGNAGHRYDVPPQDGMTLLDYFAAAETLADCEQMGGKSLEALAGSAPPDFQKDPIGYMEWEAKWRARVRFIRASATLAERERIAK